MPLRLLILLGSFAVFSPPLLANNAQFLIELNAQLVAPSIDTLPAILTVLPAVDDTAAWPVASDNTNESGAVVGATTRLYADRFAGVPVFPVDIVANFDRQYIRGFKASPDRSSPNG